MYSDQAKKKRPWLWVLLFAVIIAGVVFVIRKDPGRDVSEESLIAIRETVERSALQCYAVEGVYPPSLNYLRDNYGLTVNTKDFYISYEVFASNQPPTIRVKSKSK